MRGHAALAVASLLVSACKQRPNPEASVRDEFVRRLAYAEDAGPAYRLTSTGDVFFDDGWYPMETLPKEGVHGEAWRWMGRTSIVRVKTQNRAMRVRIAGWVPYHLVGTAPAMTLRWNGKRLDSFLAPSGRFTREIEISPAMQAGADYGDFMVETSSTGSERGDRRELGFALADFSWEPMNP